MIRIWLDFYYSFAKNDVPQTPWTSDIETDSTFDDIKFAPTPILKKCKYLEININSKRYGF